MIPDKAAADGNGGGLSPPIDVINRFSETTDTDTIASWEMQKIILSGSMTADVYKTLLNITGGGGIIKSLAVKLNTTNGKVIGTRVTIDGTIVFNGLTIWTNSANYGLVVFGDIGYGNVLRANDNAIFTQSLLVEVSSSITETDGLMLLTNYQLT